MAYNRTDWLEGGVVGVTKRSPTQSQPAIFVNTFTGDMGSFARTMHFTEDAWTDVDVAPYVPKDTLAIFLTGILGITQGPIQIVSDLWVAFKANDAQGSYNYNWQTTEWCANSGQRSTISVWIPLTPSRTFSFKWHRSVKRAINNTPSFLINLSLNAYLRYPSENNVLPD